MTKQIIGNKKLTDLSQRFTNNAECEYPGQDRPPGELFDDDGPLNNNQTNQNENYYMIKRIVLAFTYFRQIWLERQNEISDNFSCPRYHGLQSKQTLHGRCRKEGQHDHEINGIGIFVAIFRQCHKCSTNFKSTKTTGQESLLV